MMRGFGAWLAQVCLLTHVAVAEGRIKKQALAPASVTNGWPQPTNPEAAMRWRRRTLLSSDGTVRRGGLMRAMQQRRSNAAYWRARGWQSRLGPEQWRSRGPTNVGGRTRSLLVNPQAPETMLAGSVSGGLWRSTDGGASWQPVDDFLANLAVCSLAADPSDPNVIYAGTGEGFFNADAIQGAGIFKSTDGGASWRQLPASADWTSVNRIAVSPADPRVVLAAVRGGGIFRTSDGGESWTAVREAQGSYFVAFDPNDPSRAIAQIIDYDFDTEEWFHAALTSTDGGVTWVAAQGLLGRYEGWLSRIELAYAPSQQGVVYASLAGEGSVYKSTDGGRSFTKVSGSSVNTGANWYANLLWVCPTNANLLVIGGVGLSRSNDGGRTFSEISAGYILTSQPHPDMHFMVADPRFDGTTNTTVYVCTDGGVFRTRNIFTASTTSGWESLVEGYTTTQYYGAAASPGNGLIVGGTQDNGTLLSREGIVQGELMFGGDGGFCAADPTDPNYLYGEYIFLRIHRSRNAGATASYIYNGILDAANNNANFIAPFILDPNDANRMLAGGASLWRSNNVKAPTPSWAPIRLPGSDAISAIAVLPGNSNEVWIGQNDGRIYKSTNALSASPSWDAVDNNGSTNPLPDRYPTRIVFDPSNPTLVYVAFGGFDDGNLMRSSDGGATWQDVTGTGVSGLPEAPVRGLAVHPTRGNVLYAATEVGIFESGDGGASWSAANVGPANVSVDEVFFAPGTTTLVAATHGRGLWTADLEEVPPCTVCIDSIDPSTLARSTKTVVYLNGSGFQDGARITVSGDGVIVKKVRFESVLRLRSKIKINGAATPGPRDVTVTNPDGTSVTVAGAITIQ